MRGLSHELGFFKKVHSTPLATHQIEKKWWAVIGRDHAHRALVMIIIKRRKICPSKMEKD